MNRDLPSAKVSVSVQSRFSMSWIVPTIALIITVLLFIKWEMSRGSVVSIEFQDTSGLTTESPIIYRGAIIGRVEKISLDTDRSIVVVRARLDASAVDLAREGTQWWIVKPTVSLQGISGLETIIGPRYIQLEPGTGETTFTFVGSPASMQMQGKHFSIITSSAEKITVGVPIFYRGVEIGTITSINFAEDATNVYLNFMIEQQFSPLIRTNSIFWNVGGIQLDAGFFGLNLHTGPLTSLIKGGISMAIPDDIGGIAPDGFEFSLSEKFDKDWLDWSPTIDLSQQTETE